MPDNKEEMEQALKAAYERGVKDGLDKRRIYVDFVDEASVPLEWDGYTNAYEEEVIASIVNTDEYVEQFRQNMVRQAMLKWRQARLNNGNPAMVGLCFGIGNAIMDLVQFYDNAGKTEQPNRDANDHGYNTLLE